MTPTLDGIPLPLPDPRRPDGRLVAYIDLCRAIERLVREYGEEDAVRVAEWLLLRVASGRGLP